MKNDKDKEGLPIDFEGGLYAAATSVDEDEDLVGTTVDGIYKWLESYAYILSRGKTYRCSGTVKLEY